MKKIISVLALAVLVCTAAFAQKEKGNKEQWREKVRAEQAAFIKSELKLSDAEAQKFWPVYEEIQARRREAFKESFDAMKALKEDLDKGGDSGKSLDKYLSTKKKIQDLDNDAVKKYSKVLPKEKLAKLVLTEEHFRHNQIGKFGHGGQHQQGGHRPHGGQHQQ
jgi:hypothetical protein